MAQDAVVALAASRQGQRIGSSAVEDEEDLAGSFEEIADPVCGGLGPTVIAIGRFMVLVGFSQGGPGFRSDARVVVRGEMASGPLRFSEWEVASGGVRTHTRRDSTSKALKLQCNAVSWFRQRTFQVGFINKKPPRDLWDPFGGYRLLGVSLPVSGVRPTRGARVSSRPGSWRGSCRPEDHSFEERPPGLRSTGRHIRRTSRSARIRLR